MTDGLLCVLSEPGGVPVEEFHDWYDNEHVPLRRALPGIRSARRLRALDGERPTWGAMYDIDLEVLDRPDYLVLRRCRSLREQAVVDRLATLDRRSYALVSAAGTALESPAVVVMTSLSVAEDSEQDLHAWYEEEHVPMLLAVPGWARVRRYRLEQGDAPRWLALHELSDPQALETEAYRAAVSTHRRAQVMRGLTARERRVWAVHRDF